jgi:hypothetical protein
MTVPRPSARIVLLDDADRLLLFSTRSELDGSTRWFTAGGERSAGFLSALDILGRS